MRNLLIVGALSLVLPAVASAKKGDDSLGIPLEVQVLDKATMEPIKTAKVRNPKEKEPHAVNADNGVWKGDVLYLPDGQEVFFAKGMVLEFEISAPGYENAKVQYEMRKRKNKIVVPLNKMEIDIMEIDDDPVIQFGRDKPIGGRDIN